MCADLVRQVLVELSHEHEGRRVDITVGDLAVCQADPSLLKQVFVNLLANALKFGAGSPIAVLVGRRGVRATLTVADHGVGIDPHRVQDIFRRFERAVSPPAYGGLGLGLYIVSALVAAHGGEIHVESEPGQGASVGVSVGTSSTLKAALLWAYGGSHCPQNWAPLISDLARSLATAAWLMARTLLGQGREGAAGAAPSPAVVPTRRAKAPSEQPFAG